MTLLRHCALVLFDFIEAIRKNQYKYGFMIAIMLQYGMAYEQALSSAQCHDQWIVVDFMFDYDQLCTIAAVQNSS